MAQRKYNMSLSQSIQNLRMYDLSGETSTNIRAHTKQ